jgi:LPS export ABC transporter permease LptG/LPS export ABC transporter permease LptF
MRIIDRYVMRQVLTPFGIGLLVFTFVFIIEALRQYVEPLVAKGVPADVLVTILATLIPQALALSIPMALLLGLLVAFGRLSGDREFVAMQACGISLQRLLAPVAALSIAGWAATSYVMLIAVPGSNQLFREVTFNVIAQRAEGEVKPRVFFDDFPHLLLYVREVPPSGKGWIGVFMADSRPGRQEAAYLARRGGVIVDRDARTVDVVLEDGEHHTLSPDGYRVSSFRQIVITVDPATVFPSGGPLKSDNEMTIAELRQRIAEHEAQGVSTHNQRMAIHRKFAIPVACLVFGVMGLALGATNHRGGALGSFGFGLAVVFAYYLPMYFFPQMTKGGFLTPWLAVWLPNILIGGLALILLMMRNRMADQPLRPAIPRSLDRVVPRFSTETSPAPRTTAASPVRVLDRYVGTMYLRLLLLSLAAAMAIFYISTFIDLSDKLFKGTAAWTTLFEYFVFASAQYVYYSLPIAALIAALVTVGTLTRNSELVVIRACGVSLYRTAVPMLVTAVFVGLTLYLLDASVLGSANRRAEGLRDEMKGAPRVQPLHEPWLVGSDGTFYHVRGYDAPRQRFDTIDMYEFSGEMTRLIRRTHAARAAYIGEEGGATWRLEDGWSRTFAAGGEVVALDEFAQTSRRLEPVSYFAQEPPDAEYMSHTELRALTDRLRASGYDVAEYEVGVARKVAYPFVGLIMTLIAIPFAVTMGRSGTMAGIAAGIALALLYWGTINISAALGAGGVMAPMLAAWAPNLLFASGALYLVLTVRT